MTGGTGVRKLACVYCLLFAVCPSSDLFRLDFNYYDTIGLIKNFKSRTKFANGWVILKVEMRAQRFLA